MYAAQIQVNYDLRAEIIINELIIYKLRSSKQCRTNDAKQFTANGNCQLSCPSMISLILFLIQKMKIFLRSSTLWDRFMIYR